MRFQQFVTRVVNPVVQEEFESIEILASEIDGGWESWMQIELYFRLRELDGGIYAFGREKRYPGRGICDFCFRSNNAPDVTTWVELKVQLHADPTNTVDRFANDIEKVRRSGIGYNDTAGAVVVIPFHAEVAIESAREKYTYLKNRIRYYLIDSQGASSRYDLWEEPMIGDEAIVMYFT